MALEVVVSFTDKERKALKDDGAVTYLLSGETIADQKSAGRPFGIFADPGYIVRKRNRLTEFPSRRIEVAVYPHPEKIIIKGSSNKTLQEQRGILKEDEDSLKKQLGLPIEEILAEAPEISQVLFKHFDATGDRLLGPDSFLPNRFPNENGLYDLTLPDLVATCTPLSKKPSSTAVVGRWYRDNKVGIYNNLNIYRRENNETTSTVGVIRWVVPQGTRKALFLLRILNILRAK